MPDKRSSQRDLVKMEAEEVLEFIHNCHTLYLSTLNRDGTIHSAAMWYGFLGDQVGFSTRPKTQKAKNLLRNPSLTCLFESGSHAYDKLQGVQINGTARILEDPSERFEVMRTAYDRNVAPYSESDREVVEKGATGLLIVAVEPNRIASWDHSKMAPRGVVGRLSSPATDA